MSLLRSYLLTSAVAILIGCATGEGLDEGAGASTGAGGVAATSGAGGNGGDPSGGSAGETFTGGTSSAGTSSGGTSSGGVAGGGTSSGGTAGCPAGEKKCSNICVAPNPGIGCSLGDCAACPSPPPNSVWMCSGDLCDFSCNTGYTKQGSSCVGTGSGGSGGGGVGGSGGTGGTTGCPATCDVSKPETHFVCAFYCAAFIGTIGLCGFGNCCVCT
jgi:hypothetical protein